MLIRELFILDEELVNNFSLIRYDTSISRYGYFGERQRYLPVCVLFITNK